jgi:hypothetical protein
MRVALSALSLFFTAAVLSVVAQESFTAQNPLSQSSGATFSSTAVALASVLSADVAGIWENSSRFIEFKTDGKMRVVLKPYYGFVYEDSGAIPFVDVSSQGAPAAGDDGEPSLALVPSASVHRIAVRYAGEKYDQFVPLAVIGDGMYFRFFRRVEDSVARTAETGAVQTGGNLANGVNSAQNATGKSAASNAASAFSGFWLAAGNADALRIYRSGEVEEFFSYYFSGSTYYRIRYWVTDGLKRDVDAQFEGPDGSAIEIPKFITIGETLYTCITSTGTTLRNYEKGTFELKDGTISFKPSVVAYAGTAASVRKTLPYAVSADGSVLAIGSPYLVKSKVVDLDAEIKAHNGKRRPPRKPVFDYMKLDFHWDEVEQIRNNGMTPGGAQ